MPLAPNNNQAQPNNNNNNNNTPHGMKSQWNASRDACQMHRSRFDDSMHQRPPSPSLHWWHWAIPCYWQRQSMRTKNLHPSTKRDGIDRIASMAVALGLHIGSASSPALVAVVVVVVVDDDRVLECVVSPVARPSRRSWLNDKQQTTNNKQQTTNNKQETRSTT
jgi:hypothetical protein